MSENIYKIIIVEDNKKQSDVMELILGSAPNFNLVGTVPNFGECKKLLEKKTADIAIVDIDLSEDETGIDVIRYISDKYPEMQVVVNTVYEDSTTLFEAFKAGAHGYVLKDSSPVELFAHINNLCNGDVPISPKIARRMLTFFKETLDNSNQLTQREVAILDLADKGYTYAQIADMLNISKHTVHTHFKQIYQKLKVSSKSGAVKKAKKLTML